MYSLTPRHRDPVAPPNAPADGQTSPLRLEGVGAQVVMLAKMLAAKHAAQMCKNTYQPTAAKTAEPTEGGAQG